MKIGKAAEIFLSRHGSIVFKSTINCVEIRFDDKELTCLTDLWRARKSKQKKTAE
jgi:hypothetical protein